jgi:hypothetical protein
VLYIRLLRFSFSLDLEWKKLKIMLIRFLIFFCFTNFKIYKAFFHRYYLLISTIIIIVHSEIFDCYFQSTQSFYKGGYFPPLQKPSQLFYSCQLDNIRISENDENININLINYNRNNAVEEAFKIINSHIDHIPSNIFEIFPKMDFLEIKNSSIVSLEPKYFEKTQSLTKLMIWWNPLSVIEKGTFSSLSKLLYLSLQKNHISLISEKSFIGLASLRGLYLEGNLLTYLEQDTFSGLNNLEVLDI